MIQNMGQMLNLVHKKYQYVVFQKADFPKLFSIILKSPDQTENFRKFWLRLDY